MFVSGFEPFFAPRRLLSLSSDTQSLIIFKGFFFYSSSDRRQTERERERARVRLKACQGQELVIYYIKGRREREKTNYDKKLLGDVVVSHTLSWLAGYLPGRGVVLSTMDKSMF